MKKPYLILGTVIFINSIIMFALTYIMVWSLSDIFFNLNRFYMALIMAMPMVIIMILLMADMFKDKALNIVLIVFSLIVFTSLFFLIRTQTPIGNEGFLRSMIPHHSSAILMCEESNITDPEIERLCDEIVKQQKEEINEMKHIMER
jgi:hypothetical protein